MNLGNHEWKLVPHMFGHEVTFIVTTDFEVFLTFKICTSFNIGKMNHSIFVFLMKTNFQCMKLLPYKWLVQKYCGDSLRRNLYVGHLQSHVPRRLTW